jgi:hypothetical protein
MSTFGIEYTLARLSAGSGDPAPRCIARTATSVAATVGISSSITNS